MIELAVLFALSLAINVFLAWYTRNTLSNLLYLSENLGSLHDLVSDFGAHLKTVYELERFYGDPTLTSLLEHSNAVREELEVYADIIMLSEQIDENEEEEEFEGGGEEEA